MKRNIIANEANHDGGREASDLAVDVQRTFQLQKLPVLHNHLDVGARLKKRIEAYDHIHTETVCKPPRASE